MAKHSPDFRALTTLTINVVRWDSNQMWRRELGAFVRDDLPENYLEYSPFNYLWEQFQDWIVRRMGYQHRKHAVFFAQVGARGFDGLREVPDVNVWEDILMSVAVKRIAVAEYADLCFVIKMREVPLAPPPGLGHLYPESYIEGLRTPRLPLETGVELSSPPNSTHSSPELTAVPNTDSPSAPSSPESDSEDSKTPLDTQTQDQDSEDIQDTNTHQLLKLLPSPVWSDDIEGCLFKRPMSPLELPAPLSAGYEIECIGEDCGYAIYEKTQHLDGSPDTDSYSDTEVGDSDSDEKSPASSRSTGTQTSNESSPSPERTCATPQSAAAPGWTRARSQSASARGPSRIPPPARTTAPPGTAARGRSSTRGYSARPPNPEADKQQRLASIRAASRAAKRGTPITETHPPTSTQPTRSNSLHTPQKPPTNISPTKLRRSSSARTTTTNPFRVPSCPEPQGLEPLSEIPDLAAADYHTASAEDTDYGAASLGVIDTFVGSYNAGDTTQSWNACLEFFNINPSEHRSREALQAQASSSRARVPVKRLPGMSVGLFDYQLMGTLKMLKFVLRDVSGGLLCDEQGLGKTQEMYGVVALANGLQRCKAEVKAAWRKRGASPPGVSKKGVTAQHNAPGSQGRTCPFDERYGFRCYCYCEMTRELADRLPEGPNIMVAPARNCAAMIKDAKTKLDVKHLKIRGFPEGPDKEDKLTQADIKSLRATVTAIQGDNGPVFQYQAGAGQSDYVIVVSPENLARMNAAFTIDVRVPGCVEPKKRSALLPGMILMDEFHEYIGQDSRTVSWLQHLKKCTADSQQPAPLTYFVSGTPFDETPADIRPVISLLEKEEWQDEAHPLYGSTLTAFDDVTSTFDKLIEMQASGEVVSTLENAHYHRRLDRIFKHMMVRRLGTDQFQGRNLTDIGPLKVSITDHQLPSSIAANLQALADRTRDLAAKTAAATGQPIGRLLRSKAGEDLLLKLRLASIFPGIAGPSAASFTFTRAEIASELTGANGDVTKTAYYPHIPTWAAHSPKLETLNQTIATMLTDTSKIPGEPSHAKKYCIFTPLEAEAVLLHGYLLLKRTSSTKSKPKSQSQAIKPTLLHHSLPQPARQPLIDAFLTPGNAPPNILIAPIALAGTGLNLQKARYSTVTGPAWTKRENQQAYYRIHRVGQKMETRLQLLTGRWNPAERIILGRYEGKGVGEDEEGLWEVGNRFCEEEGIGGEGLVERHQEGEEKRKE